MVATCDGTVVVASGRRNRSGKQSDDFYPERLEEQPIPCGAKEYRGLPLFFNDCKIGPGREAESTGEHARVEGTKPIIHSDLVFPSPTGWSIRAIDSMFPIFDEEDIFTKEHYTRVVLQNGWGTECDAKGKDIMVMMSSSHVCPPQAMDYLSNLRIDRELAERELRKQHIAYIHIGRNSAGLPRKQKEKISGKEYYDMSDGRFSGASQEHPHSRVFALTLMPPDVMNSYEKVEEMARTNGHKGLLKSLIESGTHTIEEGKNFVLLADPTAKYTGGLVIASASDRRNITELDDGELEELAGMLRLGEHLLNVAYDGPPFNVYYRQTFNGYVSEFPHYVMSVKMAPRDYKKNGVHATLEIGTGLPVLQQSPLEVRERMLKAKEMVYKIFPPQVKKAYAAAA